VAAVSVGEAHQEVGKKSNVKNSYYRTDKTQQPNDQQICGEVPPMRVGSSEKYATIDAGTRIALLIGLLLVLGQAKPSSALQVPPLRGRVNDLARLLSHEQSTRLEEQLTRFEQQTGHQIAVLTIPSLEGDALEDFSIRVAEAWKIGQKGFDNGAILLIVRDDRKLRIEVGYGLEGVLPDAIASRIIREIIVPRFRENDFAGGMESGISAMMQVTRGESLPEPSHKSKRAPHSDSFSMISLLLFVALIALLTGITQRSNGRAAVAGAISSGILGLPAMAEGMTLWLSAIFIGSIAAILASLYARRSWGRVWDVGSGRHYDYSPRDVFYGPVGGGSIGGSGASGYGGSGSGGSSGGGFSGGGGGFGGGGASGSW